MAAEAEIVRLGKDDPLSMYIHCFCFSTISYGIERDQGIKCTCSLLFVCFVYVLVAVDAFCSLYNKV